MIKEQIFSVSGRTPYAPSLTYSIIEAFIDNSDKSLDELSKEILEKEKKIIEDNEFISDWGTRLGKNSLTSRSGSYNILQSFDNVKLLHESISEMHKIYLDMTEKKLEGEYYIQGWANVMRDKEKIFPHRHCPNPYSYLSGHVCMQVKDTYTHYIHPFTDQEWHSPNEKDKITLFPSFVKHYTDSVPKGQTRITIAFDIITEEAYNDDIKESKKSHWIKL